MCPWAYQIKSSFEFIFAGHDLLIDWKEFTSDWYVDFAMVFPLFSAWLNRTAKLKQAAEVANCPCGGMSEPMEEFGLI